MDTGAETAGVGCPFYRGEIGSETDYVRCGHGCARDGVLNAQGQQSVILFLTERKDKPGSGWRENTYNATTKPRRRDKPPRSININKRPVIRRSRHRIRLITRAHGTHGRLRRRREASGIRIRVAGRGTEKDAAGDQTCGGRVHGGGEAAAEGHVDEDAVGAGDGGGVGGDGVHGEDDSRDGAGAVVAEGLEAVEVGGLGDAVGVGADDAGDVGAVAVAVGVGAADEVLGKGGAAAKVLGSLSVTQCSQGRV